MDYCSIELSLSSLNVASLSSQVFESKVLSSFDSAVVQLVLEVGVYCEN